MKELSLEKLCPDINRWPKSWEGLPADVAYGQKLLEEIKPFLEYPGRKNRGKFIVPP